MSHEERNKIDRLERDLYSRRYDESRQEERSQISKPDIEVAQTWEEEQDDDLNRLIHKKRVIETTGLTKKIFIGSFIFFIISFIVAFVMFLGPGSSISPNNIEIMVLGPTSVTAGEELSLDIIVKNRNKIGLEDAAILIEYPEGSREVENMNIQLLRQRESLGLISSNREVRRTVKSTLFGEKDAIKEIKITLEYRVEGSSAWFYKEKYYDIGIKSAPIIVRTSIPIEVNSGQDVEMVVEVISNTTETLQNLIVSSEYPFGFSYQSSVPEPTADNNTWFLGDLPSGEKRIIRIQGKVQGQDEEQRTVRFFVGISGDKDIRKIETPILSLAESYTIKRPFVDLVLSVDGKTDLEYAAIPGRRIQINIVWTNNLPNQLLNIVLNAELSGEALNRNEVSVSNGGFFRSINNTVTWDSNGNPDLVSIPPGGRGVVSFTINSKKDLPPGSGNQKITIKTSFSANQVMPAGPPQQIFSSADKIIKLNTDLALATRMVHSVGPFSNSGPLPPKSEEETTYSVILNVTNSYNNVSGALVRTNLPTYVSWVGLTSPSSEKISYDPTSRTVIWDVGDVPSGTGFVNSPKEVAFQIVFEPSLSQVGTTPNLTGAIQLSGYDVYTNQQISISRPALTTSLGSDPFFTKGQETVAR